MRRARRATLRSLVAAGLLLATHGAHPALSAPTAPASGPVTQQDVRAVLDTVAAGYAAEDVAAILAVHSPDLAARVKGTLTPLFQARNYLTLQERVLSSAELPDGTLRVDVITSLRSRPKADRHDRREKRRWTYAFARGADGRVRIVATAPGAAALPPAETPWRVEDFTGRVSLSPTAGGGHRTPEGRADVVLDVRIRNVGKTATKQVSFALHAFVDRLEAGIPGAGPLELTRVEDVSDSWWGTLPADVEPGAVTTIHLDYSFSEVGDADDSAIGLEDTHLFSDAAWHPVFRRPRRDDPVRATHDVTVEVPASLVAVMPGVLAEQSEAVAGRRTFRWFSRFPGAELGIVAGDLHHEEVPMGDVGTLDAWLLPGDEPPRALAARVESMLRFGKEVLGAVPTDRVSVVHLRGGVSRAAPAFFALFDLDPKVARPEAGKSRQPLFYVAHGLAHLWFVDTVAVHGPGAEVLTEGLSDHLASAWAGRELDPALPGAFREEVLAGAQAFADLDRPLSAAVDELPKASLFGQGKALVVLDMYRAAAGEDRWRQALASYWSEHRGREAVFADLVRALAGDDPRLTAFCATWVLGRGFADFAMTPPTWTPVAGKAQRVTLEVRNDGIGPSPLHVEVVTDSGAVTADRALAAHEKATLTIEAPDVPKGVRLDPGAIVWEANRSNNHWPIRDMEPHPDLSHPATANPAELERRLRERIPR